VTTSEQFKDDVFIVDENEEFTEESMNPEVKGSGFAPCL
jgi:type I restriction enzyme R subunit